jgi:hypothetical protein
MIAPESICQNCGGTAIKSVLTFNIHVKKSTETPKDTMIVNAFLLCTLPPLREPPTIMGNSGSTQGANTVSTPARNEIKRSSIYIKYTLSSATVI